LFPSELFDEAIALQETYKKLYVAVAGDEEWLYATLKNIIQSDTLAEMLWNIHTEVKEEGYVQDLTLGIFRSDYMLHSPSGLFQPRQGQAVQLRQVEFNTVSCAGGVHGNRVSDMHQYLVQTGAYETQTSTDVEDTIYLASSMLPPNHTVRAVVSGLSGAHRAYGAPKSSTVTRTCVLFIVQPRNFNIADEKPIEYALWEQIPPIPTFRVIFGSDVLAHTSLGPSKELIYHPPSRPKQLSKYSLEVSVVYMRAGFEVHEYDDMGRMARLRLEKSRAIKCPSILSHFTTFKKVQQALAMPGSLERFLSEDEAVQISKTFAPIYPMDDSDAGLCARKLAMDPELAREYVLKPSLEGGGHNVYGENIPKFLAEVPAELWPSYVLMKRIQPPILYNALMSARGIQEGPVVSELGVFGICLWRRSGADKFDRKEAETCTEIARHSKASWSFKTKDASVNEMSVVKGYGCFDSPALIDLEKFSACCHQSSMENP
jgi:glutathione synthetase